MVDSDCGFERDVAQRRSAFLLNGYRDERLFVHRQPCAVGYVPSVAAEVDYVIRGHVVK